MKDEAKFHSEIKGCNIEKVRVDTKYNHKIDNLYCHTHHVQCSKTGWEIGWHGGTNNRNLASARDIILCTSHQIHQN
jgi:hypothetical protein